MVGGAAERFALTYACVLVVNGFAVSWTAAGLESRWRASGVAGDGGSFGDAFLHPCEREAGLLAA